MDFRWIEVKRNHQGLSLINEILLSVQTLLTDSSILNQIYSELFLLNCNPQYMFSWFMKQNPLCFGYNWCHNFGFFRIFLNYPCTISDILHFFLLSFVGFIINFLALMLCFLRLFYRHIFWLVLIFSTHFRFDIIMALVRIFIRCPFSVLLW